MILNYFQLNKAMSKAWVVTKSHSAGAVFCIFLLPLSLSCRVGIAQGCYAIQLQRVEFNHELCTGAAQISFGQPREPYEPR